MFACFFLYYKNSYRLANQIEVKIFDLKSLISCVFSSNRDNDTLIHLLKGSLGTGILAMPNAFFNSGYAVGFVGTIVIGIICTYCIHMLLRSHYELCKRKKVSEKLMTQRKID